MSMATRRWRRHAIPLAGGIVGSLLLSASGPVSASPPTGVIQAVRVRPANDAPATAEPIAAPADNTAPAYTLGDLIRIACEHQPVIAAAQASLAAAQTGSRGLDEMRVPTFILRDLPARRQQGHLGVQSAEAALGAAQRETAYSVIRLYFSVQFARAQEKVAGHVVDELQESLSNAKLLLGKAGAPRDLTQNAVDRNEAFLGLARTRLIEAQEGERRALAALREAIGLGPDCDFTVPNEAIPTPAAKPSCKEIVALALQCRGEIVEADVLAQATALEIEAQKKSHRHQKTTFAAYTDLHATAVPVGEANNDYRPGALSPALPTTLAGKRSVRVELAQEYAARSAAVADKTRNLVALEAENTFLQWFQASRELPEAEKAYKVAQKAATATLSDFKSGLNVPYRDVLESVVVAAQIGAQANEIRFHYAIELAALERVTGGGFCSGLVPVTETITSPATPAIGANMIGD
jgi:outer membrane protein TolC